MAVIYRQEFFAFCRVESFTRWRDYYCCLCKKVGHIGCDILRVFATSILPIRYAGKGYNISVRYRENTGSVTQIISVNITFTQYCHKSNVFIKRDAACPRILCAMLQVSCYK